MPLYLTISEGPSAVEAKPYLVTADQKIIRVVAGELAKKLGLVDGRNILPLKRKTESAPPAENPKN